MKFIAIIFLTVISAFAQCEAGDWQKQARRFTHDIYFAGADSLVYCRAVAIGPRALLTAGHCEEGQRTLMIDNEPRAVLISDRVRDDRDHAILFLAAFEFDKFIAPGASLSPADPFVTCTRGDCKPGRIFGETISGESKRKVLLTDARFQNGESGTPIFTADGELVTVVTARMDYEGLDKHFGVIEPLAFTPEQIEQAKAK